MIKVDRTGLFMATPPVTVRRPSTGNRPGEESIVAIAAGALRARLAKTVSGRAVAGDGRPT
jgi:hypothetical protein